MSDFRDLPPDVKREIVYDSLRLTKACVALSSLTDSPPEFWAGQFSGMAYQDMEAMSEAEIDAVIIAIETQRRNGYGVARVEIKPKGFGKP